MNIYLLNELMNESNVWTEQGQGVMNRMEFGLGSVLNNKLVIVLVPQATIYN
jgi:hypothetical protein